ncbi:methyltransferase [Nocardia sp. NPDC006044]|uniref:methyltransferase n=1 Tax=Nocardia sp. NPDC006044 TaxID=3364306 RepID=UPI0036C2E286
MRIASHGSRTPASRRSSVMPHLDGSTANQTTSSMGDGGEPTDTPVAHQRRELLLMRVFQSQIMGPVLRKFANPLNVLQAGMTFWSSRVVLLAVEDGLFTELAAGPLAKNDLIAKLGWHQRAAGPVLDALTEIGLLRRRRDGRYANSRQAALFLDRGKPSYVGGLLELSSKRLYELWSGLDHLLRTGGPEAEEERGDNEFFTTLYRDPVALENFLSGMTGISTGEAMLIAARFPWKHFRTFVDIGSAQGALPVRVALTHPHLSGASLDLAAVGPVFEAYIASFGLSSRIRFISGNMHVGPLPTADVICFGHLLHGYSEATRCELISKAYAALPAGGALLVYDAMVRPGRRDNLTSYLSSVNIMLETREGFEATTTQCIGWLRDAGFVDIEQRHLIGPTSMVYGRKPGHLATNSTGERRA